MGGIAWIDRSWSGLHGTLGTPQSLGSGVWGWAVLQAVGLSPGRTAWGIFRSGNVLQGASEVLGGFFSPPPSLSAGLLGCLASVPQLLIPKF